MVPYEAFLSEKPVVTTTDAGGPLEVVTDRVTGLVAEPRAEALAAAFARLERDDAAAWGRAGTRARRARHLGRDDRALLVAMQRSRYYSPLPPSRSGIADYSALLLPGARASASTSSSRRPGRFRRDAEGRRRALPRRQRPGRARLDRRGAPTPAGRRRPARVRAPPPRLRDHARPRRRRGLLRGARARGRAGRPRARPRGRRRPDPAALGDARRRTSRSPREVLDAARPA